MKKYAPRKVFILENGEYVELSYEEFESRKANDPTYEDRYFIPVQGFLMEVSKEHYKDFYRAKEREAYLKKLNAKYGLLSPLMPLTMKMTTVLTTYRPKPKM